MNRKLLSWEKFRVVDSRGRIYFHASTEGTASSYVSQFSERFIKVEGLTIITVKLPMDLN